MNRILLVDDDASITSGLSSMILAQMDDVEIAVCSSGVEALEHIRRQPFELLITDILMPGMTGLELLENLNQLGIQTPALVISGYDDFSYVRQALRHRACDYMLKPVKQDDLLMAVRKALEKAERKKTDQYFATEEQLREDAAAYLLTQSWEPRASIRQYIAKQNLTGSTRIHLALAKPIGQEGETALQGLRERVVRSGQALTTASEGNLFLLFPGKDGESIKLLLKNTNKIQYTMTQEPCGVAQLPSMASKLEERLNGQFFDVDISTPFANESAEASLKNATQAILKRDEAQCRYALDCFLSAMLTQTMPQEYIVRMLTNWFYHMMGEIPDMIGIVSRYALTEHCFLEQIQRAPVLSVLRQRMNEILGLYLNELRRSVNRRSQQIERVKEYIKTNLGEPIQIGDAATLIGVHPNYLSTIFKQSTGISFRDYLRDERIKAARNLILTTDLKLYEIAEKVGYGDPAHFSRAFKQVTGVSPQKLMGSENK